MGSNSFCHFLWAFWGALICGFPSRKIFVVGVTGTKGKTTTTELIAAIFEAAGRKTAVLNSYRIKTNGDADLNRSGMSMPGRGAIQRFLRKAAAGGCEMAVIEVTSQGVLQHRHRFIRFGAAVFVNIHPAHIEAHGSFEKYREAKLDFFRRAGKSAVFIVNRDDASADRFASAAASPVFFSKNDLRESALSDFLKSDFNRENAAAAAAFARARGIGEEIIKKTLLEFAGVPGRLEYVQKKPFAVVVDYAHTPDSLDAVYKTLRERLPDGGGKMICVLGAAGGGRDKWKRVAMGKIAAESCDEIILTDEDPYDEEPAAILADIKRGIGDSESEARKAREILDRGEAICEAVGLAQAGDIVIITGKGSEPWMHLAKKRKIPWSDREAVLKAAENGRRQAALGETPVKSNASK